MVDIFRFQRGTSDSAFGIGLDGCLINNVSNTKLAIKNNANDALAKLEVASPTLINEAVNKITLDKDIKPIKIAREADCSSAVPDNTAEPKKGNAAPPKPNTNIVETMIIFLLLLKSIFSSIKTCKPFAAI